MNLTDLMDTPRICTAFAEWGGCLVSIMMLRRKISGVKLYAALGGMLAWFLIYHSVAGMLPLFVWIPGMLGAIISMWVFIRLFCDISWKDSGFCCLRSFVLAELAASLQWQIYVWFVMYTGWRDWRILAVIMTVIYIALFTVYYFYERSHIPKDESLDISGKELFGAALIALGAFLISNLSFVLPNTPFSTASSSILYVRTLVDFGGLVMLIAQMEKREELRVKSENQIMNIMLQRQYDQYRLSIDNIELLRREYHDMKHYMVAIRAEENPEIKAQYLDEMEHAIVSQEALIDTGNHVLDVLLTAKNTYCLKNNITFTCMAEGRLLSFMHVKDICSIFGNALDNAIECVSQYSDPEKRLITLSMYQKNKLLMIKCENYSEAPLILRSDNLPRTTKSDSEYHGYGLKSIKSAAEKYGGSMNLHSENNWFTLQVLIPVSEYDQSPSKA